MDAATVAGRSHDGSLMLLALGCLAVGFLMLGHGLMTPGIGGRLGNQWVGRLLVLAITAFAACLSAAAWPQPSLAWAARWPRGTLAAGGAGAGGGGRVAVARRRRRPALPGEAGSPWHLSY